MKVKYLITIVVFLVTVSINAQEFDKKGHISVGIEGGPQITGIKGFAGIYSPVSKVAYYAGVFGDYFISNDLRIRIGAYYDNRRFGLEGYLPYLANEIDDTIYISYDSYYLYQVDYNLNYLTFPVGLVYTKGNSKFKVQIQANFYYSLFINATYKGSDNYYIHPDDISYFVDTGLNPGNNFYEYSGSAVGVAFDQDDILYHFNTGDYGFNFSVGGMYLLNDRMNLTAGIGFTLGIANIFQDSRIDSNWSQITKFNIGFNYILEKKNKRFGNK